MATEKKKIGQDDEIFKKNGLWPQTENDKYDGAAKSNSVLLSDLSGVSARFGASVRAKAVYFT